VRTGRRVTRSASRKWLRGLIPADGGIDTPPPPPPCPPGWQTGPPDFVGVGVQRSGTTRWFNLLASHPEIARSQASKELHYFDRYFTGEFTSNDAARYHEYFPRPAGSKVGEWTPFYISAPWIPRLLAQSAPNACLLVILRDPVDRYLSGMQLNERVAKRRRVPLSRFAPLEAFARGFYHAQLAGLLRHFERDQLLLLQYERCTREPLAQLRRTFEFIGLSDTKFAPELGAHPQRSAEKSVLQAQTREDYARAYLDDVERLIDAFPEIDVSLWPNFSHLVSGATRA
jgi:hypothetical protein